MIVATLVVAALSCSPHADAGINITAAGAALTAMAVLSWGVLALCNAAMQPVEKSINNSYVNDARRIIGEMPSLKVVGITGSYGKTSTKHYLNRILSEQFNVVMTPGSFNTPMGVTRTIREMLKPYTEIFICEMGAKQRGDIKEICDIVHPQYGIITAVGEQHMESFKSIENVQRTKFELADALLPTASAWSTMTSHTWPTAKLTTLRACAMPCKPPQTPTTPRATLNIRNTAPASTWQTKRRHRDVARNASCGRMQHLQPSRRRYHGDETGCASRQNPLCRKPD